MTNQTLVIDGAAFSTLEEFYDEFTSKVIPGADWGHNLDAFNDVLRGGFGTPSGGFRLLWRNAELSRLLLGYKETTRQLRIRLERCHPSNRAHVQRELEAAVNGRGPTVFDWLCEIIRSHKHIELELE
jgi:RNAse (barnase) inhibitor barstar